MQSGVRPPRTQAILVPNHGSVWGKSVTRMHKGYQISNVTTATVRGGVEAVMPRRLRRMLISISVGHTKVCLLWRGTTPSARRIAPSTCAAQFTESVVHTSSNFLSGAEEGSRRG